MKKKEIEQKEDNERNEENERSEEKKDEEKKRVQRWKINVDSRKKYIYTWKQRKDPNQLCLLECKEKKREDKEEKRYKNGNKEKEEIFQDRGQKDEGGRKLSGMAGRQQEMERKRNTEKWIKRWMKI